MLLTMTGSIPGPANEKNKSDFVASLRDVCVHLVHSHDGARLTMQVKTVTFFMHLAAILN